MEHVAGMDTLGRCICALIGISFLYIIKRFGVEFYNELRLLRARDYTLLICLGIFFLLMIVATALVFQVAFS